MVTTRANLRKAVRIVKTEAKPAVKNPTIRKLFHTMEVNTAVSTVRFTMTGIVVMIVASVIGLVIVSLIRSR